jgi:hypothetical protein
MPRRPGCGRQGHGDTDAAQMVINLLWALTQCPGDTMGVSSGHPSRQSRHRTSFRIPRRGCVHVENNNTEGSGRRRGVTVCGWVGVKEKEMGLGGER